MTRYDPFSLWTILLALVFVAILLVVLTR